MHSISLRRRICPAVRAVEKFGCCDFTQSCAIATWTNSPSPCSAPSQPSCPGRAARSCGVGPASSACSASPPGFTPHGRRPMVHFHCERDLPGRLDARCLEPLDRPHTLGCPRSGHRQSRGASRVIFVHTADLHLGSPMRGLSSYPDAPPSGSARRHAMPLSSGHIPARVFNLRTHTTSKSECPQYDRYVICAAGW